MPVSPSRCSVPTRAGSGEAGEQERRRFPCPPLVLLGSILTPAGTGRMMRLQNAVYSSAAAKRGMMISALILGLPQLIVT
jgi:hypothetical protein